MSPSSVALKLMMKGRTAVVTGAGGGLGRAYALELGRRGANVLVNDLSDEATTRVAQEIVAAGGRAETNTDNVVDSPEAIIASARNAFSGENAGNVDILVNNAGILRDKSFVKATRSDWDSVVDVHLGGTYGLCKEAWGPMVDNGYGRIVNVGSGAGLYGNFGQHSYSAAKMGILGLTQTLALEGAKHGITANVVVPIAESKMTETVLPGEILALLEPEHIASLVSFLCHERCDVNGATFECGGGWYSQVRWQRSEGVHLGSKGAPASAEVIAEAMASIRDFDTGGHSYPTTAADALKNMISGGGLPLTLSRQPPQSPRVVAADAEGRASMAKCASDAVFTKLAEQLTKDRDGVIACVGARAVQFALTLPDGGHKVYVLDFTSEGDPRVDHFASVADAEAGRQGRPAAQLTITVSDADFMRLCSGDMSTEWAYATGKMTVDGSMGVAMKMKALLSLAGKL